MLQYLLRSPGRLSEIRLPSDHGRQQRQSTHIWRSRGHLKPCQLVLLVTGTNVNTRTHTSTQVIQSELGRALRSHGNTTTSTQGSRGADGPLTLYETLHCSP